MSTLKADTLTTKSDNTNISITGAGTGKVALGDGTLIFPDADGSANQPIITNGSAALSFATLPIAGGGTGSTSTTYCNLTSNVTGTMPVANGGTGATTATAGFDALSPMTAEGDVLYGGTSGTVTKLAKGSNDEVLTLAAGVPSWAAAAGGAWNLVDSGTVSGVANLEITDITKTCIIWLYNVFIDSGNFLQGSTDNGTTYLAGTNYMYSHAYIHASVGSWGIATSTGTSGYYTNVGGGTATYPNEVMFYIIGPENTGYTLIRHNGINSASADVMGCNLGAGAIKTTTPIDAVKISGGTPITGDYAVFDVN